MKLKLKQYPLDRINKNLFLFIAVLLLFIWLAAEVVSGNLDGWDRNFLDWVRHFHHPSLMILARVSYFLGEAEVVVFIVIGILAFLCWKRYWKEAQVLAISALGVLLLIDKILKPWFGRIRPAPGVIDVHGKSFPSGHLSGNFMLYLYLSYLVSFYFPKWGIYFYIASTILVSMMGWASIYLNIHWFTDLIGGLCIGYLGFIFCVTLLKLISKKYRDS
ncbi:phosphatase PAP2 family protein [Crocosphaera sp. UHCC 0190]|uniref:phosphatase PAP2 family protein n=1 Tax=Crocosphaera sp. UHCC 0190 TaxID=3110246 RepID=UPI002B20BCE1|nr:phosphatase PAP2 family protein [Crocosphaera sp. UHCC 0190]MEA5508339.1 phosphatase PAP2 family protein [Crocosphaera sp. UHCC 0190]